MSDSKENIPIKVGYDLHGVIDKYLEQFKKISDRIRNKYYGQDFKCEIYIISGPPIEELEKELKALGLEKGVHYNEVKSVVTYLKEKGVEMWQDENGNWWANDEDWWNAKGDICDEYDIDVLIDDSPGYRKRCEELGIVYQGVHEI